MTFRATMSEETGELCKKLTQDPHDFREDEDRRAAAPRGRGLELLGHLAPAGVTWTYPLADESRRCFAGYLPKAIKAPQSITFFQTVRQKTKSSQPRGRAGPMPR